MAESTVLVDAQNPWPGLSSFTESAQDYFFGRENEIREILSRIEARPFTLLFGQSGLGKTSLLQAGLMPRLRKKNYLPIYLRLDYEINAPDLEEQITRALLRALAEIGAPVPVHAPRSAPGESLWEWLHRTDARLTDAAGRTLTPILILDQFEEIFTLGERDAESRARSSRWFRSLAYLVENWCPAEVKDRMQENDALLEELDLASQPIRILLSMREDFLPHLDEREAEMPSMMLNRLRLTPLSGTEAIEAVMKPAPRLVARPVAEAIVRFVSGEEKADLKDIVVATPILNLVCRELNERRKARKLDIITPDLIEGDAGKILRQFYEECLAGQPTGLRIFIEEELLSSSGHRENISEEQAGRILARDGLNKSALEDLVTRRLLQKEERLGRNRFELIHDVLCGPIAQSRAERAAREKEERDEAERKAVLAKIRVFRRRLVQAGVLLVVFLLVIVYALWEGYQARQRSAQLARVISLMDDDNYRLVVLGDANPEFKPLSIDFFTRDLEGIDKVIREGGENSVLLWTKLYALIYLSDSLSAEKESAAKLQRTQGAVKVVDRLVKLDRDGDDRVRLARDLGSFSKTFFQLHDDKEGQETYDRALQLLDQVPGKSAAYVHKTRSQLINDYYLARGDALKPEQKDAMMKQSLVEAQQAYEANSGDIAYAGNLAVMLLYRASYLNDFHPGTPELSAVLHELAKMEAAIDPMTDKLDSAADIISYRNDMAYIYQTMGQIEQQNNKWDDAEDSFKNYVNVRENEIAKDPTVMGKDYNYDTQRNLLATAYNDRGDFERALARNAARDVNKRETALNTAQDAYEASLAIAKDLTQTSPKEAEYWATLGNSYDGLRQLAVDRAGFALDELPSNLVAARQYYQQAQNGIDEYIGALKEASEMADPQDKDSRARSVAIALRDEGDFEVDRSNSASEDANACFAQALGCYNDSLALLADLLKQHPSDTNMELSSAYAHNDLRALAQKQAEAAASAGHDAEARTHFQVAEKEANAYLAGMQQIVAQKHAIQADDLGNQCDMVDAFVNQGGVCRSEAEHLKPPPADAFARADKCYAAGLALVNQLVESHGGQTAAWSSLDEVLESMAESSGDQAEMALARGDVAGAKALYQKASDQVEGQLTAARKALAVATGEDRPSKVSSVASALGEASYRLLLLGKYPEALQDANAAIWQDPTKVWITTNQAHALLFMGRFDDAWAIYQRHAFERLYSDDKQTFAQGVDKDFDDFEKARALFTPQQLADMEKIRRLLQGLPPPAAPADSN